MSERAAMECLLRKAPFHFKHISGFLTLTLQFGGVYLCGTGWRKRKGWRWGGGDECAHNGVLFQYPDMTTQTS